jgi:hypothetical protein
MKKWPKKCIFLPLLLLGIGMPLLLCLYSCVSHAHAEASKFNDSRYGIALELDSRLEQLSAAKLADPYRCILQARLKGAVFPAINVIVRPVADALDSTTQAQFTTRTLESYLLVGLTDAELESSSLESYTDGVALSLQLRYSKDQQRFNALVLIFTSERWEFTLSIITLAEQIAQGLELRKKALNSLRVDGASTMLPTADQQPSFFSQSWIWLLALVVLVGTVYRIRVNQRIARSRS